MKPTLKPSGTKRLKLRCDVLLSNGAFKFKLRRYTKGQVNVTFKAKGVDNKWRNVVPEDIKEVQQATHRVVGYTVGRCRCRLTL